MYDNPIVFRPVTNREAWHQIIQIADDETGDLISLTDANGNPLFGIYLEISPSCYRGSYSQSPTSSDTSSDYSSDFGATIITSSYSGYVSIIGTGTIEIQVPYSIMQSLCGGRTYDVYMRLVDAVNDDARQLFVGKLPVAHGGRRT